MRSMMRGSRRAASVLSWVGLALGLSSTAAAQDPKVTINGGVRSGDPQWFDWNFSNGYSSPIVKIEIPHTNGDSLEPPPGWRYKWLKGADAPAELGKTVCRAVAEAPDSGIAAGRVGKFTMRVNRDGALPRKGTMRVTFADGKQLIVAGVELPSGQQTMERGIVTITLGVFFVLFLILHARRRRRAPLDPSNASEDAEAAKNP